MEVKLSKTIFLIKKCPSETRAENLKSHDHRNCSRRLEGRSTRNNKKERRRKTRRKNKKYKNKNSEKTKRKKK